MKKVIIVLGIISITILVGAAILFASKLNESSSANSDYVVKPGYKLSENTTYGYRFQYREELTVDQQSPIQEFNILGGNSVHSTAPLKGYQRPAAYVRVYDRSIMKKNNLKRWVDLASTEDSSMVGSENFKYVSSESIEVVQDMFVFLVNKNPVLNKPTPTLLVDNGKFLYEISGVFESNDSIMDLITSFQTIFDGEFMGLNSSQINTIQDYLIENENF